MIMCTHVCIGVKSDLVLTLSTDGYTHTHTIMCSIETEVLGAAPLGLMGGISKI